MIKDQDQDQDQDQGSRIRIKDQDQGSRIRLTTIAMVTSMLCASGQEYLVLSWFWDFFWMIINPAPQLWKKVLRKQTKLWRHQTSKTFWLIVTIHHCHHHHCGHKLFTMADLYLRCTIFRVLGSEQKKLASVGCILYLVSFWDRTTNQAKCSTVINHQRIDKSGTHWTPQERRCPLSGWNTCGCAPAGRRTGGKVV